MKNQIDTNIIKFPGKKCDDSSVVDILFSSLNDGSLSDSKEVLRLQEIFYSAFNTYKKLHGDFDISDFEIVAILNIVDDTVCVKYNFDLKLPV